MELAPWVHAANPAANFLPGFHAGAGIAEARARLNAQAEAESVRMEAQQRELERQQAEAQQRMELERQYRQQQTALASQRLAAQEQRIRQAADIGFQRWQQTMKQQEMMRQLSEKHFEAMQSEKQQQGQENRDMRLEIARLQKEARDSQTQAMQEYRSQVVKMNLEKQIQKAIEDNPYLAKEELPEEYKQNPRRAAEWEAGRAQINQWKSDIKNLDKGLMPQSTSQEGNAPAQSPAQPTFRYDPQAGLQRVQGDTNAGLPPAVARVLSNEQQIQALGGLGGSAPPVASPPAALAPSRSATPRMSLADAARYFAGKAVPIAAKLSQTGIGKGIGEIDEALASLVDLSGTDLRDKVKQIRNDLAAVYNTQGQSYEETPVQSPPHEDQDSYASDR